MSDDMERSCISLLALQAPVAGDLRVVVAALSHTNLTWCPGPLPATSFAAKRITGAVGWRTGRKGPAW